jgi:hypothetical protein
MTDSHTTQQPAPKMTGAERVQRFRRRKAKDMLLVEIELYPTERDKLIKLGLLHKSRRSDKGAVRDALEQFLETRLDPPPPSRTEWALGEWKSNGGYNG